MEPLRWFECCYSKATNLLDLLSWVEGERVLGQADLQVGMAQFGLTGLVEEDLAVIVPGYRVGDHTVVTWRHHGHTYWRKQHSDKRKGGLKQDQVT